MALTGLQIFKLLPNTNCKECAYPTCLSFAMKLAAGKEALDKCPYASDEIKAALGAASLPPIRGVTIGSGDRAVTVGEETVFFRHEKTFVRPPGLFRLLDPAGMDADAVHQLVEEWTAISMERAGETFRVDGIAVRQTGASAPQIKGAVEAATKSGMPVALLADSADEASAILAEVKAHRPLLVPPREGDQEPFARLAAELGIPLVVHGTDPSQLAERAEAAAKVGVESMLLAPPSDDSRKLHQQLSQLRRAALDRAHPGVAYPVFLRLGAGELEKGVIGIAKFASLLVIEDADGASWLPLWALRQNIYTDPQKPLQMDAGLYPIGEPDESSPLLVTTNFSLTYFIVATELDGTGVPCWLAVVDTEGMSVLTAWSAGKMSGEIVGKALTEMSIGDRVKHGIVIIPGLVAVISGELEDALGAGWSVYAGPQEASDVGTFFRSDWKGLMEGRV